MAGIWGDGQRGGIFGAKVDPRLAKKRIAAAFAASEGMQEPSRALYEAKHQRAMDVLGNRPPPGPTFREGVEAVASLGPRAVGGAQKMWQAAPMAAEAFWNDPLGSINRVGLAGQAATDAIVQGAVRPFTQFGDPNVDPAQQAADLALTAGTGGLATAGGRAGVGVFGGRLAKTADLEKLKQAEEMAAAGIGRDEIFRGTGWFKGPDDKWRFEIDDSAALARQGSHGQALKANPRTLSEALDHPEFFAAYPEMQDMPFSVLKAKDVGGALSGRGINPMLTGGAYGQAGGKPWIGVGEFNYPMETPSQRRPLQTTLHELQHATQDVEGFAQGSGLESAREVIKARLTAAEAARDQAASAGEVVSVLKSGAKPEGVRTALIERARSFGLEGVSPARYADESIAAWEALGKPNEKQLAKMGKAAVRSYQEWGKTTPMQAYQRSAGETEARNVTGRMDMTAEQRRSSAPWNTQDTPDKQQLVSFNMPGDVQQSIKAYHGSPHDFERFDASKIGTGEGAQAYGHGLYFAEREGVAKEYRDNLKKPTDDMYHGDQLLTGDEELAGGVLMGSPDKQAAVDWLKGHGLDRFVPIVERLDKSLLRKEKPDPGRMYEVDIAADPEHFLDWDKPLSQQSPKVQAGALGVSKPPDIAALRARAVEKLNAGMPGEADFLQRQADYLESQLQKTGAEIHSSLFESNWMPTDSPDAVKLKARTSAAQTLQERGIPGIRYLDQGSRPPTYGPYVQDLIKQFGSKEKALEIAKQRLKNASDVRTQIQAQEAIDALSISETHNYVVFDEKLISILRKYGLPISAAGLAALSQLHPEEAQAAQKQKGR